LKITAGVSQKITLSTNFHMVQQVHVHCQQTATLKCHDLCRRACVFAGSSFLPFYLRLELEYYNTHGKANHATFKRPTYICNMDMPQSFRVVYRLILISTIHILGLDNYHEANPNMGHEHDRLSTASGDDMNMNTKSLQLRVVHRLL
jgi:hypothetical protein